MKRHYRKYTDEEIVKYSKEVKSLAGLLKKCGLKVVGGNYDNMKRNLQRLKVNTDHWTGQGWNKNQQLKDYQDYKKSDKLKPHVIRDRGHQCESCNHKYWRGQLIPLDLHHINQIRSDNNPDNLQLLCPNCHYQTHNKGS